MGVSKEQTARNKQAIIEAAARLFRERGVDGVGLTELMHEAGFTQGGFFIIISNRRTRWSRTWSRRP